MTITSAATSVLGTFCDVTNMAGMLETAYYCLCLVTLVDRSIYELSTRDGAVEAAVFKELGNSDGVTALRQDLEQR